MSHQSVTQFLHSRYAMIVALVVMVATCMIAEDHGAVLTIPANTGIALTSPGQWIDSAEWSMVAATGLVVVSCLIIVNLVRVYNFLRAMTMLPATLLAVMLTAMPTFSSRLGTGIVLMTVILICSVLLFRIFDDRRRMHNIFLIFFILSGMTATQYAFAVYIPVMVIGCLQMRVFTLRTLCAAVMGVITPWWILFGFGIISPSSLHLPEIHNIFTSITLDNTLTLVVTIIITGFIAVASWLMSLMKIMTYNAPTRAFNGFFAMVMFMTLFAMAVDYTNIAAYLPLLCMCAAINISHIFVIHRHEKTYIAILCVILVYYLLYLWRML